MERRSGQEIKRGAWRPVAALALAVAITAGCGDGPTTPVPAELPLDLSQPWQVAKPAVAGVDPALLAAAVEDAGQIERFRSLLVVRSGYLVQESYFGGGDLNDLADVRSVTKSVVSTLTGLALERGHLESLDQTLDELLPTGVAALTPDQEAITVRHLLTMTAGFEWSEAEAVGEYNDWIGSGDQLGYLLDRPIRDEPGTVFQYNSAAVDLLGVVLQEAVGRSLSSFADEALFGPAGIGRVEWESLGIGRVNGGSGIDLTPRDLARLGQLMLQEGRSGSRQVLPGEWVRAATTRQQPWTVPSGPIPELTYGYLWWVDITHGAFLAWGFGGQFIYVAPERELVVVATTEWRRLDGQSAPGDLPLRVLEVIVDGVLPAAPVG